LFSFVDVLIFTKEEGMKKPGSVYRIMIIPDKQPVAGKVL